MVTIDAGKVLFGQTRGAVLSLMMTCPDESFYLREIVRRTGCGVGAVQRELRTLVSCGILKVDRRRFFSADRDSAVFEPLAQLVIRTAGVGHRLTEALHESIEGIEVAFLFGSFARIQQRESSDVDVMIVTKKNEADIDRIHSALTMAQAELGREVNPFVLSVKEFRQKHAKRVPFILNVLAGEKVFLIGGEDELERLAKERVAEAAPADAGGDHQSPRARRPRLEKRQGQRAR